MVTHAFNPNTLDTEEGGMSDFEDSPVYRASLGIASGKQRNPISKKQKRKENMKIWTVGN